MTPGVRKFVLTVHLTCSIGWIGAVVAYLALGIAAVTSPDAQTVRAVWTAMEVTGWWAIVPLAVAALLTGALPLAEAEPGTVDWFAARTSPTTFWIFDTFGDEDARQAHINGEIAAALMAKADELLASPPEILPAEVLARK